MVNKTHAPDVRRDTILVVDDTPETLGFLTDTLDHAGFTALIATDGESALRLEGKAQGSKRLDDGRFDVRLKLTSLRRDDRSALERAFE